MNQNESLNEGKVYRVKGFSCAGCAKRFEDQVKELDGVVDAKVNFGASKLTVAGDVRLNDLKEAAKFEKLQIVPDKPGEEMVNQSFWEKYWQVLIAFVFLVAGLLAQYMRGEQDIVTVIPFLLSIVIGGYHLFMVGLKNLVRLKFDMQTLMTIAIIGAAIIGEWSEGAIVVILFAVSEALEGYSMDKARRSITSLMDLAPDTAVIRRDGREETLPVHDIAVDDIMIVKPGQKIAMDGLVVKGLSNVNQAAITGESIPVEKTVNDEVFAGTLNEEGLLEVKVTKLAGDTTLAKMLYLVEEAQDQRAPSQSFVDVFAKYYTPAIMVLALLVAVIPPLLFGAAWTEWIYEGLAVLVVGCPCALVISTPVAIVTAIGNGAKNGLLIKGGMYLENAGALKALAFDKTGTLTKGVPALTDYRYFSDGDPAGFFSKITALEAFSNHPLSRAFIGKAETEGWDYRKHAVSDFLSTTGKGIRGSVDGEELLIGNASLFSGMAVSETILAQMKELQQRGRTAMLAGTPEEIIALVAVADETRESSKAVVSKLHAQGIEHTIMLTGDTWETANGIARSVGVSDVAAGLLPEQKMEKIKELKETYGTVAMVGDGVNDAPALAAADIGIAMGGVGSDTALETADIAIMGDDLEKLPFLIHLSRKTLGVIKQNIAFALGIKLIALLLVIPGWLTLWIAIIADVGATLIVTLNGMRLMRLKQD